MRLTITFKSYNCHKNFFLAANFFIKTSGFKALFLKSITVLLGIDLGICSLIVLPFSVKCSTNLQTF